jgi:polysaccharide export outer membrane protein
MSNKCPIFGEVSLAVAFFLISLGFVPISAQTTPSDTRPRSLANPNDDLANYSAEKQPQVGSPEANAKAKKLYKTGVQYGNAGLFTQAAEVFRQVVSLKPDHWEAYRSLGHAYIDLDQGEEAVEALEHALTLNPKDKEARRLLDQARLKVTVSGNEASKSQRPVGTQVAANMKPLTSPPSTTKLPENESALTKIYRVGAGDVLDVILGTTAAADSGTTVTTSGLLIHPSLVEPLPVAGLTVEEITTQFQTALGKQASIVNVSVGIREYVSHAILVSGLVKEPGTKILQREAIPLAVVVADAQPLPEAGTVTVVRNKSNETFTVDLTQPDEMSMLIHSGDVITLLVTPTQFFYVAGEVKVPGEKTFRRGLTLTQAIFIAGGPTGKPKEVRISRDNGKGFLNVIRYKLEEIESGKLQDPLIHPGDRILIIN